jgi:hypothetical protein
VAYFAKLIWALSVYSQKVDTLSTDIQRLAYSVRMRLLMEPHSWLLVLSNAPRTNYRWNHQTGY